MENIFCALQIIKNELDPNTDPLAYSKKGTSEVSEATKVFFQNIYQVIELLFVAGVALTLEIVLIKIVFTFSGPTLEALKKEIGFKIGLVILFFSFVYIINYALQAIQSIL